MARLKNVCILFFLIIVSVGCKNHKGDIYASLMQGDSLIYIVAATGQGEKVSRKAHDLKLKNEYKGNECSLVYLTDSVILTNEKGVLLINSSLPNIKKDMLTKGYFGTFTSRQRITYMLVSFKDMNRYFRKSEIKR